MLHIHEGFNGKRALAVGVSEGSATYKEIKAWIKQEYDMNVTNLYIAQIKDKCGFAKRDNYNIGSVNGRVPNCPAEKEKAILGAFKHFGMI